MGAGHWAKVGSDGADSLDAGFLVIGDDRDRRLLRGSIRDRPAHLNLTIDAKHFGHFWFELGITPLHFLGPALPARMAGARSVIAVLHLPRDRQPTRR